MAIVREQTSRSAALLAGDLVAMRPVESGDLPVLNAWDQDPEIIALMGQKFASLSAHEWFDSVNRGRSCRAMVIETLDGRLIGELELAQINWRAGSTELRICIGEKDCWSKGYGTDAMRLTLRMAFDVYHLRVVYLRVFATNARAIRLYERTGFRTQAVLQPSARRGDPSAVLLMNITRERWERNTPQTA